MSKKHIILFLLFITVFLSPLITPSFSGFIVALQYAVYPTIVIVIVWYLYLWKRRKFRYLYFILLIPILFYSRSLLNFSLGNADTGLKVLSYNVMLLREPGYDKFSEHLIRDIIEIDADIACLQEFSYNSRWKVLDYPKILKQYGYNSALFEIPVPHADHNPCIGVFSKYPIIRSNGFVLNPGTSNNFMYADILAMKDTIRVFNTHLSSMQFLAKRAQKGGIFNYIKYFFNRFKITAVKREREIQKILGEIEKSPYPVILTGDFNEIPCSGNILSVFPHLDWAFLQKGNGFSYTLNNQFLPIPIDYQWYSKDQFTLINSRVLRNFAHSDHFPVIGYYELKKP